MGIVVVLIAYAIALTAAAFLGAIVLGLVSRRLTRKAPNGGKRVVIASVIFPFACVIWAGLWFVAYAFINSWAFNRDPGLGDSWETPLPNGYALIMIDTTDQGTVYNPETQGGYGSVSSRDDAVFGVRELQVSGNLIFGARDNEYFQHLGQESNVVNAYFELDTKKKTHVDFRSIEELQRRASDEGVALHLREFQSVFGDYRTTWFDYFAGCILLLIPLAGFVLLGRSVWRTRQVHSPNVDTVG